MLKLISLGVFSFSIDLEVGHGQLVAVVGHVGAGKSSLVSALLGEMNKVSGQVTVNVRTSRVFQSAYGEHACIPEAEPNLRAWRLFIFQAHGVLFL